MTCNGEHDCLQGADETQTLCCELLPFVSSPEHEVLMVSYCGQWLSVVRRRPSCVVRRASTIDVYTLETTFVTWFWWNLIRMFVLTISRLSSNMGHVGSKSRSPGQISGNSCLHPRGHICDPILMKLCQNVCFDNIWAKFEYGLCRVKN